MELGISSLGHFNDLALNGKIKSLKGMQIKATEHCLNFAEEYGIKIVELVIDPPGILNNEYKEEMIDLIKSYSLKKQVHGPYIDVNLCSCNARISKASIESNIEIIKISHQIDANIMTIHPGLASYISNSIRELNKTELKKSIHHLLDFTSKKPLLICLENMP
ncbi:MAG: TIM barrel protein [Candidatus Hermodarchaeota archaeon]